MNPKPQTLVILKPVYFPTASHFLFSSVYRKSKPVNCEKMKFLIYYLGMLIIIIVRKRTKM